MFLNSNHINTLTLTWERTEQPKSTGIIHSQTFCYNSMQKMKYGFNNKKTSVGLPFCFCVFHSVRYTFVYITVVQKNHKHIQLITHKSCMFGSNNPDPWSSIQFIWNCFIPEQSVWMPNLEKKNRISFVLRSNKKLPILMDIELISQQCIQKNNRQHCTWVLLLQNAAIRKTVFEPRWNMDSYIYHLFWFIVTLSIF